MVLFLPSVSLSFFLPWQSPWPQASDPCLRWPRGIGYSRHRTSWRHSRFTASPFRRHKAQAERPGWMPTGQSPPPPSAALTSPRSGESGQCGHLQPGRWDGWNGWNGTCSVDGPSGVGAGSLLGGILSGGSVRPAVVSVVFVVFWWVQSSSRGSATGPPHPCQPSQAEPTFLPISKIVIVAVQRQTQMQTQKKRRRHELEHEHQLSSIHFQPIHGAHRIHRSLYTPWKVVHLTPTHSLTHSSTPSSLLLPSVALHLPTSSAVPSTPPAARQAARHPTDTTPHTLQLITQPIPL